MRQRRLGYQQLLGANMRGVRGGLARHLHLGYPHREGRHHAKDLGSGYCCAIGLPWGWTRSELRGCFFWLERGLVWGRRGPCPASRHGGYRDRLGEFTRNRALTVSGSMERCCWACRSTELSSYCGESPAAVNGIISSACRY